MRSISINVAGHRLQIRSDAEEEYVQGLAEEITKRFSSIRPRGQRQDQSFRAMTMVAIALLDELRSARESHDSLREKAREFAANMIGLIDGLLEQRRS